MAKGGTAPAASGGGGGAVATANTSALTPNLASALCYFPLLAILFLLLAPYNKNRTIRFHAWQCLGLVVAMIALEILLSIATMIIASVSPALAEPVSLVSALISLCGLLLFLVGMFKAYNNQRLNIPILSPLAEKMV